jgi:antigen flippase
LTQNSSDDDGAAESSSYRRILWATTLVGGATLGALLIGLARNKAVALIGGPEAVGLLGVFMAIVSMAASVATLGLDTSAVRQLAQHSDAAWQQATTRRAIWTMALPLALVGAGAVWLFRTPLAQFSTGSTAYGDPVGSLALGVAATVIASSQLAVLQGYGRVADLARVKLWGSLFATILGIGAVYRYGVSGIVIAVVSTPILTALLAFWVGRDLQGAQWKSLLKVRLSDEWRALAAIGALVMLTNAVASLGQLWMRSVITQELGLDSTGFYHASFAIVSVNLSLVLNAMAADYYPRISKVAHSSSDLSAIFNQQLHVGLVLVGPALTAAAVLAPQLLTLLYSGIFAQSELLLRILIVAGILRLPIWALGFILLARKDAAGYLLGEVAAASAILLAYIFIPIIGLNGAGLAAILSSLVTFLFYLWRVQHSCDVRLNSSNFGILAFLIAFLSIVAIAFHFSRVAGLGLGTIGFVGLTCHCYRQLRTATTLRAG